jgi:hypothetical protein
MRAWQATSCRKGKAEREEGKGKREEGKGKREKGRGKREKDEPADGARSQR